MQSKCDMYSPTMTGTPHFIVEGWSGSGEVIHPLPHLAFPHYRFHKIGCKRVEFIAAGGNI
jgi:hypothetical protein